LRGDQVEIVLAGVIRYSAGKKGEPSQEMPIHCSASRTRETEWVLVFKEPEQAKKETAQQAQ